MTRALRVAVVDHTGQLGGAELALVRLCAALDPNRVVVVVVLFSPGPLVARLSALGIDVRVLPLAPRIVATDRHRAGRSLAAALMAAVATVPFVLRLARLLREVEPDLVHATSLKADLICVPAAALVRRPLVWHIHDLISDEYLPAWLGRAFRAMARRIPRRVVVNSHATARSLLPLPRGWTLAYPGLAPDQVASEPPLCDEPRPLVIGMVGRVSPTKGQREFVQACALVADDFPGARFRIVGSALFEETDYQQEVLALIDASGLRDRFDLTGWVADPRTEMDRLSVLVHASPVAEPFGQVVVEAMARRVPVVATRGGGITEIVEPDRGEALGVLVAPGDSEDLARGIRDVLRSSQRTRLRAISARESVIERFPVARTAEALMAAWELVASTGRGRRRSA